MQSSTHDNQFPRPLRKPAQQNNQCCVTPDRCVPTTDSNCNTMATIFGLYPGPAYLVPSTRKQSSSFRVDLGGPTWYFPGLRIIIPIGLSADLDSYSSSKKSLLCLACGCRHRTTHRRLNTPRFSSLRNQPARRAVPTSAWDPVKAQTFILPSA